MYKIGIDAISFYTSSYYLDLITLAAERNVSVDKYYSGVGLQQISIAPEDEDIVTLATNAAARIVNEANKTEIDTVLFATESGIDQSKSAGIYVHSLLKMSPNCRVIELKEACYSATAALQMAIALVARQPTKKVLVLAADIARYDLNTAAESTQGCGAVAMIISANPQIIAFEPEYGVYCEDVMDFWRPNYATTAFVEGKYSSLVYLRVLQEVWQHYHAASERSFKEHDFFCYHTPVPRLVEKAHKYLYKINGQNEVTEEQAAQQVAEFLQYSRVVGNSYTASLYIGLASLLDHKDVDMSGKRIGFYSYGSGCVAEYFSGIVQPGYKKHLLTQQHQTMLMARKAIDYAQYEQFYHFALPTDGREFHTNAFTKGARLAGIVEHKRIYEL